VKFVGIPNDSFDNSTREGIRRTVANVTGLEDQVVTYENETSIAITSRARSLRWETMAAVPETTLQQQRRDLQVYSGYTVISELLATLVWDTSITTLAQAQVATDISAAEFEAALTAAFVDNSFVELLEQITAELGADFASSFGNVSSFQLELLPIETTITEFRAPTLQPTLKPSSADDDDNEDNKTVLSPGAIAGIVIGGLVVILLIVALAFCIGRGSKKNDVAVKPFGV